MKFQDHIKVLIIEKNESILSGIVKRLESSGARCLAARSEYEALQLLNLEEFRIIVMDEDTALISPEDTIKLIRKEKPNIPIIVLLEPEERRRIKRETLVTGTLDYLPKPVDSGILLEKIAVTINVEDIRWEVARLQSRLEKDYGFSNIIGRCRLMEDVFQAIEKIANSDVTVYIRGESGTGKELIAREIHRQSRRKNKPFIAINCAAIPETLLESELFGHEKGAFTGAVSRKKGKFEAANNGTLFLDEIGDMSLILQSKILRILEEQEFERVGGNDSLRVNVRIITATNKDLISEVQQEKFRKDLFYRINVYPIYLPSLRERKEDIPLLVSYFIDKMAKKNQRKIKSIAPGALQLLADYQWPGNVRELENVIERAVLICPGAELDESQFTLTPLEELPFAVETIVTDSVSHVSIPGPQKERTFDDTIVSLEEVERRYLEHALSVTQGNISRAAQKLKIGRSTLYRKLQKYNLQEYL